MRHSKFNRLRVDRVSLKFFQFSAFRLWCLQKKICRKSRKSIELQVVALAPAGCDDSMLIFFILIHFDATPKCECRVYTQSFHMSDVWQKFHFSFFQCAIHSSLYIASCSTLMFLLSSSISFHSHIALHTHHGFWNWLFTAKHRNINIHTRCAVLKFHSQSGTRHISFGSSHHLTQSSRAFPTVSALAWPKYHSRNSFFSLVIYFSGRFRR